MKIMLLTVANEDASINIMAHDLEAELTKLGHQVLVVAKDGGAQEFAPDLLINFDCKQFLRIQDVAGRFWHCGQMLNLFAMSCETYTEAQMAGYLGTAMETAMICISPAIRADLLQRAKWIFNAAVVRKIEKNLILLPYGVLDCYQFTKKTDLDQWLAPFTRFTTSKLKLHQHANRCALALMHLDGHHPKTTAYISEALSLSKEGMSTDGYEIKPLIRDRAQFAAELQKYAFALATSHFESFGLYYIECLLSGIVMVFADFPWVYKLLPGYRYVADKDNLAGMMCYVRNHYDEAFAYVQNEVVPYIRERYLLSIFAQQLIARLPEFPTGTLPSHRTTI